MITFGRSYIVDGQAFATLEDAQRAALGGLFEVDTKRADAIEVIDLIIARREAVLNILTTKDSSLPRARKANGGGKRRPSVAAKPQEAA